MHSNGEVRKIAACRIKPYERRQEEDIEDKGESRKAEEESREDKKEDNNNRKVMTEDGLKDTIRAKYLRMENSMCFL